MSEFEMHDSGTRQKFDTGAQRDIQSGKGRYDLLPVVALERLAKVYEKGAEKYDARNWEKGIPMSRFYDSALRHLMKYAEGYRDEDHLAQAMFNVMGMLHTEEMVKRGHLPEAMSDMPNYLEDADHAARRFLGLRNPCPGCLRYGQSHYEDCPQYDADWDHVQREDCDSGATCDERGCEQCDNQHKDLCSTSLVSEVEKKCDCLNCADGEFLHCRDTFESRHARSIERGNDVT